MDQLLNCQNMITYKWMFGNFVWVTYQYLILNLLNVLNASSC